MIINLLLSINALSYISIYHSAATVAYFLLIFIFYLSLININEIPAESVVAKLRDRLLVNRNIIHRAKRPAECTVRDRQGGFKHVGTTAQARAAVAAVTVKRRSDITFTIRSLMTTLKGIGRVFLL